MTSYITMRRTAAAAFVACASVLALGACSPTEVLQVRDPDIIYPSDVQSTAGANAVRLGAIGRLNAATAGGSANSEGLFLLSGMMTDEWNVGDSFIDRWQVDQRGIQPQNAFVTDVNRMLQRARASAVQAVGLLAQYKPTGPVADAAEMYFVQAFAENALAESFCNGLTLSAVVNGVEQYGSPMTTAAVFQQALAHADSGLTMLTGTTAADVRVRSALAVTKGRILLNLNRPAEAALAVAGVRTDFKYQMLYEAVKFDNAIWSYNNNGRNYSVSNNEGGTGLNFATANDPRLPVCRGADSACKANGVTLATKADQTTPFFVQLIWPTRDSSVTIASGVEARLIEAEAQLNVGGQGAGAGYLPILNNLRATIINPATKATPYNLPPLIDPGTPSARIDQLFRERAFWMFSTGHRLGDLRRLAKFYARPIESVFPTGAGNHGAYGPDVNFPVPLAESTNPNVTSTATCTNRDP